MVDEEQVRKAAESIRGGSLSLEESQRLLAAGFDPVAAVYASHKGFDQDRIRDALFDSEYSAPVVVPFEYSDGLGATPIILPMEVEVVQRLFVTYLGNVGEYDGKRFDDEVPRWYLRGLLAKSQLNPNGEVVRMHAYIHWLQLEGDKEDNWASIQVLRELPTRTPAVSFDGWVVEGKGYPTLT
jgi:hypothetical protein